MRYDDLGLINAAMAQLGGKTPTHEGRALEREVPTLDSWPDPLPPEALHGLPGRYARALDPHTEADTTAVLVQLLVAFGCAAGRHGHFVAEADKHYPNLFAVLVGQTAKGRKGTSWGHVRERFRSAAMDWAENRIMNGFSSGEGLIWQVRDASEINSLESKDQERPDASRKIESLQALESKLKAVVDRNENRRERQERLRAVAQSALGLTRKAARNLRESAPKNTECPYCGRALRSDHEMDHIGVPANPYRFVRRWLERRPPLTLRQVDPIIRQLTLYRDLIDKKTQENHPE
jgi:hypothetical protein